MTLYNQAHYHMTQDNSPTTLPHSFPSTFSTCQSIADLEDSLGHESTSSDLLNARQSIIDKLSQAGFEQTEATDIVNNIIDGLTGGSLYSSEIGRAHV